MQSNTLWNVANLKKCQLEKLSEVKTLKLNSRPTPDVSRAKKWSSNGIKFVLLTLIKKIFVILHVQIFTDLCLTKLKKATYKLKKVY